MHYVLVIDLINLVSDIEDYYLLIPEEKEMIWLKDMAFEWHGGLGYYILEMRTNSLLAPILYNHPFILLHLFFGYSYIHQRIMLIFQKIYT